MPDPKARPSWEAYFMEITTLVARRSTCIRRAVGAIIVKDKRILSTGYNGAPTQIRHCIDVGCLRDQLNVASGQRHELCFRLGAGVGSLCREHDSTDRVHAVDVGEGARLADECHVFLVELALGMKAPTQPLVEALSSWLGVVRVTGTDRFLAAQVGATVVHRLDGVNVEAVSTESGVTIIRDSQYRGEG